MRLDVYDNQNGSMQLAWTPAIGAVSYNVYLNGVLNQNVVTLRATISGLTIESYAKAAVSSPTGNSLRPQNMPPVGQVTVSGTYVFRVVGVVGGNESQASQDSAVTVTPASIMLVTPMKRLWPFPNTGLD
jgi:hypothetical protein